jgi:hypothetical protein
MPYKKELTRRMKLVGATETHLLQGVCLVCGCQICSGGYPASRSSGIEAHTLTKDAKLIWQHHRERLLAVWRDSNGKQAGVSGFNCEDSRGAGRTGLPCWAEITFDGVTFPPLDKSWPADVKQAWQHIKDYLE